MMKKLAIILMMCLTLSACNTVITVKETEENAEAYDLNIQAEDPSYSLDGSTMIELGNDDIHITEAGTYILSGSSSGASVIIEASKDDKIQLVLAGVEMACDDFAGIYVIEADQVEITLQQGTVNRIHDNGSYTQIDDNDVDALIFSKADLLLDGEGTLELTTACNHGIVSKDELLITGGDYKITAAGQGISGKDCLKISAGTFAISTGKDGLKSDNDEDAGRGYIYISGGSFDIASQGDAVYGLNLVQISGGEFTISTSTDSEGSSCKAIKSDVSIEISKGNFAIDSADDGLHSDGNITLTGGSLVISSKDDAIHADGMIRIDGGSYELQAAEGIEGTYVLINDGSISISASDDGINAGQKSEAYTPTIEINGGQITITMGQGDTDAIDSNGYIYVNGGSIDINAQSAFDYDLGAEYNGGTIIVNGETVNEISNQFGGMGGFGMGQPGNGVSGGEIPQSGFPGHSGRR